MTRNTKPKTPKAPTKVVVQTTEPKVVAESKVVKPTVKSLQAELAVALQSAKEWQQAYDNEVENSRSFNNAYVREYNKPIWKIIKERFVGFIYRMSWYFR